MVIDIYQETNEIRVGEEGEYIMVKMLMDKEERRDVLHVACTFKLPSDHNTLLVNTTVTAFALQKINLEQIPNNDPQKIQFLTDLTLTAIAHARMAIRYENPDYETMPMYFSREQLIPLMAGIVIGVAE